MIVVIGGEKGGTGKTTIATNIAALHASNNKDLLLIDTDIQGSASYWAAARDEDESLQRVSSIQKFGKGILQEVKALSAKYEDIIIDAGGRDSIELRASMTIADIIYIPVQASQFDIWTVSNMENILEQARTFNQDLKARVIFNRVSTNPSVKEIEEAREVFEEFENIDIVNTTICDRIVYRKAARSGKSVIELNVDKKASNEILNLYNEIFS